MISKEAENKNANREAGEPIYLNNIIRHLTNKNINSLQQIKGSQGY